MKTKLFKSMNLIRRGSGASLNLFRYTAMVAMLLMFGIGNTWGSATYELQLKIVTQNNTGYGKVYAGETNATPEYSSYYTSKESAYDAVTAGSKDYYLWAVPTQRGVVFNNWTTSSTSSGSCTAGSSTLTDANKMQGAKVTVKAPTNADGTDTYTTTATVTANWKNQYSKVTVTYAAPVDGKYRVTYEYSYLNTSTNALETGFTFDMDGSSAARSEDSYNNDVITLQSLDGIFEGWYNGSTLLSKNNPYTYVAPAAGGSVTISAHYTHVDKYYGKLTASIAEVPYSMPGGGTIFIANDPDVSGTYSADAQSVSNETYGESQNYYLHAQPNDKRYVFRGWYSDAACTSLISTNADYAYTFTSSSTNSASPTLGNVYAAFDFNLYYMQVEAEPAVPGLGMVFVKDDNSTTPVYTEYTTHSEQFLYAYRLAPTANAYLYAKPKYGYKFSGWYDNPDCTGTAKSTANPYTYAATGTSTDPMNPTITKLYAKFIEDATTVNITYNKPDQTKGEYTASVLDIAEVDDDFIWTFTQVFTSEGKTGNTTQAQHKTDVLRLEAQPQAGYGVTSWTIAGAAKTTPSQLYETTGTADATYGVTFGDAKPFLVSTNSTQYATLREALTAVGNSGQITVVQNAYVEAGNYTIPSGVTLLVPYESTGKSYTSPSKDYEKIQAFSKASQYVLLTLGSGVNLTLAGNLIVMSDLCAPAGGNMGSGAPQTAYGRIDMSKNSTITVNSGANLYCWGYITGMEGLVTAKSEAKIHEIFQHQNNPGGSAASGWNEEAFFLNQYYVQNIESPLKIEYGATETVYAQITVPSSSIQNANTTLIGKDNTGMFALTSSGSYIIRTYSPSTDRITYDIYGNAKLNYITLSMYLTIDTRNYVLPITNNMSVKCHTLNGAASALNIQYAVSFLPGSELIIDEGVTLNVSDKLIIYDRDEWVGKTFAQFNKLDGGGDWSKSSFTPTRTYTRVKADLVDAKVDLNGTMNVSGSVYTTNSGAAIISSNGTGVVKLSSAAPDNSNDIQYSANKLGTSIKVPMTPAQLHNGDDSYTATVGAVANDQFIYSKTQERWLKNPKTVSWNANGGETEASTLAYSEGDFLGELPAAYKDGYTLEGWFTAEDGGTQIDPATKVTANATYYAHWTPKSYTITYRDNGGTAFSGTHVDSPNAHPTTHTFGTATTLNSVNNKTGYTFGGWYRTPSCSGAQVITIAASECKNITLYAKWTINSHNLTWDANGGELSGDYTSGEVAYGTTIVVPTVSRENYVFTGWDPAPVETMPDEGDLTYTAQWTPAVASVTVSGNTTYYATIDAAFAYVNTVSANMTIKLLQDAPAAASLVYQPKSTYTCTLDLNNHTISGTFTKLINVNLANAVLTITDDSEEKGGKITTAQSLNGAVYGLFITAGKANLNAGTIESINTLQYANTTAAKKVSAYGVYVYKSSARYFTMDGGTVKANATYNAFGVYSAGTTNLKGGKIEVSDVVTGLTRNGTGYGVYVAGATTTISDDADISVNMKQKAYGVFIKAAAAIANITGGEILAKTASAKTAYGVYVDTGTFNAPKGSTTHVTADAYTATAAAIGIGASGTVNIYDGTYEAKNTKSSGTTTYGVYSSGTTNIHGGTFNVTAKASTARAIGVWRDTTTVDGAPEFNVSAPTIVYGATAAGSTPTKAGAMYSGTLIVNGGTFNVTATSGETAYGVYAYAGTGLSMFSTTNDSVPGNYISAGEVNVSDGIFNVKAKTKAYGIVVSHTTQNKNTAYDPLTAYGQSSITGGKFKVETTGDANATAYAMNTKATAANLLVEGGKYSTKRTNASETSNIEDKYTSPTKDCNYHVLPLTGEDPYQYEVAEAYMITFKNGDDVLQSTAVKKGATPAYSGATPTKAEDASYTYEFSGWDSEIVAVTEAKTYTAQFSSTPQTYNVTLHTNEGTINSGNVKNYTYGVGATLPTNVTRIGKNFDGWYDNSGLTGDAVTSISTDATGNKEYWAKWTTARCTIRWVNYDGTPLCDPTSIEWGGTPSYPTYLDNPEREGDANRTYTFKGWSPKIHTANGEETYTAQYSMSITTGEPGTYAVSGTEDAVATTVQVSGALHIPEGNSLTTGDLIVEAYSDGSGTIDGIERVTVTGNAYFDYEFNVDPWHWSAFGVPFVIDLDEAAPLKEKETELELGTDYDIIYYNTKKRAEQGPGSHCWEYVDHQTEHKLIPGVQYMIAFNKPKGHVYTVRFTKATTASINYDGDLNLVITGDATGNNNWNGIANPKMYHALLDAGVTECQVHDGGEIGKDGYYTYDMNDKKFFVGKSAFVQVPSGKKSVVIREATTQDDAIQQLHAPRRAKLTASQGTRYDVQIAPSEEEVADRLLVLTDEDKADEYVIVSDLAKAGVSPVRAQMWVDRYGEKLCKNTTSFINNKADYPIVISTPKAGEYDIFINDQPDDETMLYLTYDGEAIWNLSYGGYIANLEKGTNTHYGLRIVRTPKITTGIEEATILNGDAVRKVIVDDKVLIIRANQVYSIDGRLVK